MADIYKGKKKSSHDDELAAYLAEEREDPETDVLAYWESKRSKWPRLTAMARDVLAVTASSASSERSFSVGRDLLGLARFRLMPETMEASVCLRSWLRAGLIKFDLKALSTSSKK